jgi:Peptidase A4 family
MWVGLYAGRSLFQAGTESDSSPFANVGPFGTPPSDTCYAWYEWFPGTSVNINLPVLPGQAVFVNLEALSGGSEQGVVHMINYTTGVAITPIVVSPPTVDFNNNPINPPITGVQSLNAAWVIERTSTVVNGVGVPGALADFGVTGFQTGGAIDAAKSGTSLVTVGENDQGTLLNMIADDNVTVLSIAEELPGLVMFFTGGPSA